MRHQCAQRGPFIPQLEDENGLFAGHLWLEAALVERLSEGSNSASSALVLAEGNKTSASLG